MKMREASLAFVSLTLTSLVIANAYYQKKQFYPSVVYITKSNPSMGVIYFQAFMMVYLAGKLMRKIFFGELRVAEFEHLMERGWYAVTETCLAFTLFRDDFSPKFVALFTLLLFLKTFHWLAEDRVDFMERSPSISLLFHVRAILLLLLMGIMDLLFINHAYQSTVAKGASVQLVFGFEYAILATIIINITIKYVLHTVDLNSETPWENKAVFLLYTELVMGFFKVMLYVTFFAIMIRIYTLPLFAFRPMYQTMRKFKQAYNDVILSRRAIQNMNTLYPDATAEELAAADNVCIICREEMTTASKKLPCNHIFHTACLRSWFQRQQTCPTCRLNILRTPTPPPTPAPPPVQPRAFPLWPPPPPGAAPAGTAPQPGPSTGSDGRPSQARFMGPPIPPPFMMGMFPPPPMPPTDFTGFTDEELIRMEGDSRQSIEARLNSLRRIELLLNATSTVMAQYLTVAPIALRGEMPGASSSTAEPAEPSSSDPREEPPAPPTTGTPSGSSSDEVGPSSSANTSGVQDTQAEPANNGPASQQEQLRRLRLQRYSLAIDMDLEADLRDDIIPTAAGSYDMTEDELVQNEMEEEPDINGPYSHDEEDAPVLPEACLSVCFQEVNGDVNEVLNCAPKLLPNKPRGGRKKKCGGPPSEQKHQCPDCGTRFVKEGQMKKHMLMHSGFRPFACKYCEKAYYIETHLKLHERVHTDERPFVCSICGKRYTVKSVLKKHELTHSSERPFRCEQCGKTFIHQYNLRNHERTHTQERPFVCETCGKGFKDPRDKAKHALTHSLHRPYECEECGKTFADPARFRSHKRSHSDERPFVCEQCGRSYREAFQLRKHVSTTHEGVKDHPCEDCGKAFVDAPTLRRHAALHSGVKPFACSVCDKAFYSRTACRKHEVVHSDQRPYVCDACPKSFKEEEALKRHRRVHTGEKPFTCSTCGRGYLDSASLRSHQQVRPMCMLVPSEHDKLKIHNDKTYPCKYCGMEFATVRLKQRHERTHSDSPPFGCSLCAKTFPSADSLRRHLKYHTGERSYKCRHCQQHFSEIEQFREHRKVHLLTYECEICGKVCSDRYHLNIHRMKHSGERPFSCSICFKTFMDHPTCKKHEKTHDARKPYICQVCGRAFRLAWCLKKHEAAVHGIASSVNGHQFEGHQGDEDEEDGDDGNESDVNFVADADLHKYLPYGADGPYSNLIPDAAHSSFLSETLCDASREHLPPMATLN